MKMVGKRLFAYNYIKDPIGKITPVKPITLTLFILTLLLSPLAGTTAHASEYKIGNIEVEHPWTRATAGKTGGGFMEIENEGNTPDRLIAADSPVAKKTELHSMFMEDDVMKMRHVHAIDIPAGAEIELKPGGLHVMFMGLHAPLVEGGMVPVTLTFEKAGKLEVHLHIKEAGAMGHSHSME